MDERYCAVKINHQITNQQNSELMNTRETFEGAFLRAQIMISTGAIPFTVPWVSHAGLGSYIRRALPRFACGVLLKSLV
jgi:hypothetical protein